VAESCDGTSTACPADGFATAGDFLAALAGTAGQPAGSQVAEALRTWLDQPGVPLVHASVRCGKGGARAVVRQERLLATGAKDAKAAWIVPLCLRLGALEGRRAETVCALAAGPKAEVALPFCPDWIWPNAGGAGYHLSALAPADLPFLLPQLSVDEKLALATDAAVLGQRGSLPIPDVLWLAAQLSREPDRLLVEASVRLLQGMGPERLPEHEQRHWRGWLRRTYGARARRLGWLARPDDDDEARALRRLLVPLVAGEGEDAVLAGEALALGRRFLADRRQVPAEAAWPALEVAALHGDRELFDRVAAEAAKATDVAERARWRALLGRFGDAALAAAAVELAGAEGVDPREALATLEAALGGGGRDAAWNLLTARWDGLAARLRPDEATGLMVAAASACDARSRSQAAAFFSPRAAAVDGASRALAAALEEVDACLAARAREVAALARFLAPR